ncbi:cbb3-type cytochrome oxidase assembly protein CcoS [Ketobacter alkanivorans]|uniref:Cbb3-type cytochrome oxidase assembly protein CcoS n=1 Tax=Ketobacter alkanivorans TaxID=1917421 RepID=A0A2K9LH09_9GAMM|nr:cbb3-type cytochrome oxidase assembly protein CcoS [Ketobacter alkanivorans]AUM11441.1 cbb3-type cytochrome oxidase assembly protein CcoS [Ketobacter alkanivorans]
MDIIYLLIPLALVLLVVAISAFFWAVRTDQFDDLDREASRILFDEDTPSGKPQPEPKQQD